MPIHAAGTKLEHFHICAFVQSRDEEYEVLRDFMTEGIACGDKTVHICDPKLREDHLRRLEDLGISVKDAERTGQLEVLSWQEAYLLNNKFDSETMLALVDEVIESSRAQGFSRVRLMGHMEWALEAKPGVEEMMEYEEKVTEVLNRCQQPAICVYDLSQFTGSKVMAILQIHPYAIIGGKLRRNPFYDPPTSHSAVAAP